MDKITKITWRSRNKYKKKVPAIKESIYFVSKKSDDYNNVIKSCIIRLLTEMRDKVEICLLLPKILQNPQVLKDILTDEDYNLCLKILLKYVRSYALAKYKNDSQYSNNSLIKVVDFFCERSFIAHSPNLKQWKLQLPELDSMLLCVIQLLIQVADKQLKVSGTNEMLREMELNNVYYLNKWREKRVAKLRQILDRQKVILRWKLMMQRSIVRKFEDNLLQEEQSLISAMESELKSATRSLHKTYSTFVVAKNDFEELLDRQKKHYENSMEININTEKIAQSTRDKLMLQITRLVQKYDQSLGDLFCQKLMLTDEYNKQKQVHSEFMVKFKKTAADYDSIVRQKQIQEYYLRKKNIEAFIRNRAARIIQFYVRRYLKQRKLERLQAAKVKGSKKDKGSKKANDPKPKPDKTGTKKK